MSLCPRKIETFGLIWKIKPTRLSCSRVVYIVSYLCTYFRYQTWNSVNTNGYGTVHVIDSLNEIEHCAIAPLLTKWQFLVCYIYGVRGIALQTVIVYSCCHLCWFVILLAVCFIYVGGRGTVSLNCVGVKHISRETYNTTNENYNIILWYCF